LGFFQKILSFYRVKILSLSGLISGSGEWGGPGAPGGDPGGERKVGREGGGKERGGRGEKPSTW